MNKTDLVNELLSYILYGTTLPELNSMGDVMRLLNELDLLCPYYTTTLLDHTRCNIDKIIKTCNNIPVRREYFRCNKNEAVVFYTIRIENLIVYTSLTHSVCGIIIDKYK